MRYIRTRHKRKYGLTNFMTRKCSIDKVFVVAEEQKVLLALDRLYTCTICLRKGAILYKIASNGLSYVRLFTFEGRYAQLKRFEYLNTSKEFVYEYEETDSADPLYGQSENLRRRMALSCIEDITDMAAADTRRLNIRNGRRKGRRGRYS